MGIRYRKRVKIFPGCYINISKSGISTTIGPRGASVNFGKNGTYLNTGIPGTGLYSRDKISSSNKKNNYSGNFNSSFANKKRNPKSTKKGKRKTNSKIDKYKLSNSTSIIFAAIYSLVFIFLFVVFSEQLIPGTIPVIIYIILSIIAFFVSYYFSFNSLLKKNGLNKSDISNYKLNSSKTTPVNSPAPSPEIIKTSDELLFENLNADLLDPMFEEVAYKVVSENNASVSFIQRKFNIGYNRACQIMEQLMRSRIVGPQKGGDTSDIYVKDVSSLKRIFDLIESQKSGCMVYVDSEIRSLFKENKIPPSSDDVIIDDNDQNQSSEIDVLKDENLLLNSVNEVLTVKNSYSIDINDFHNNSSNYIDKIESLNLMDKIKHTLKSFNVEISFIKGTFGPRFFLIEINLAEGQQISSILGLEDDLSLHIGYEVTKIFPIYDRGTIGIEIDNKRFVPISFTSLFAKYKSKDFQLPCIIGMDRFNSLFCFDLKDQPHLLVAGSTGQGKTNVLHAIILSLVSFSNPTDLKLILFDSKGLEFGLYNKIGFQFLATFTYKPEIISNIYDAERALESLVLEIELRLSLLSKAMATNITQYNELYLGKKLSPSVGHKYLPFLVLIIDDYEEFKFNEGSSIEANLLRIAMQGLTVGIHVVISTKRPSADVLSPDIKSNFKTRISLHLPEMYDSFVVLDKEGAEKLYNNGDMLYLKDNKVERAQAALVTTDDIKRITNQISSQLPYSYTLPKKTYN